MLAHVSDADISDTLQVTGLPTADHGIFSAIRDDTWKSQPEPHYSGPVAISYKVTDGHSPAVSLTASLDLDVFPSISNLSGTGSTELTGTLGGGPDHRAIADDLGNQVVTLQGRYGTLITDPTTGDFDYKNLTASAIDQIAPEAASGDHIDTFRLLQPGTHVGDAEVQVEIDIQHTTGNGIQTDQTSL